MAQFLRPDSDVTVGGWSSTPLNAKLSETSPDDATTEIQSSKNPTADLFEVGLSNPAGTPQTRLNHILRVRLYTDKTNYTVDVTLVQGTTTIQSFASQAVPEGAYGTLTLNITEANAQNISDYDDLRVRVSPSGGGGGYCFCTWIELQIPDTIIQKSGTSAISGGGTVSASQKKSAESEMIVDSFLIVSQSSAHSISKVDPVSLDILNTVGSFGTGDDQFNSPTAVASDGVHIFVCDTWNHRIHKRLLSDLSYVSKYGSQGSGDNQLDQPQGICIVGDNIYIMDYNNGRIMVRKKSDLSYVTKFGTVGTGNDQFQYPIGITSDGTFLYIIQQNPAEIKKHYVSNLSYHSRFGSYGSGDNQFAQPHDIANDGTYLYIADGGNTRIKKHLASDLSYDSQKTGLTTLTWGMGYSKTLHRIFFTETTSGHVHAMNPDTLAVVGEKSGFSNPKESEICNVLGDIGIYGGGTVSVAGAYGFRLSGGGAITIAGKKSVGQIITQTDDFSSYTGGQDLPDPPFTEMVKMPKAYGGGIGSTSGYGYGRCIDTRLPSCSDQIVELRGTGSHIDCRVTLIMRATLSPNTYYYIVVGKTGSGYGLYFLKLLNGSLQFQQTYPNIGWNSGDLIRASVIGGKLTVSIAGSPVWSYTDGSPLPSGGLAFGFTSGSQGGVSIADDWYGAAIISPAPANISGGGAITVGGKKGIPETVSLSGGGSVIVISQDPVYGTVTLSGGGTISAGPLTEKEGTLSVSGNGTVAATIRKNAVGTAPVNGGGTISASGERLVVGNPVISGGGSIYASVREEAYRAVSLSGGGTIAAAGFKNAIASYDGGLEADDVVWDKSDWDLTPDFDYPLAGMQSLLNANGVAIRTTVNGAQHFARYKGIYGENGYVEADTYDDWGSGTGSPWIYFRINTYTRQAIRVGWHYFSTDTLVLDHVTNLDTMPATGPQNQVASVYHDQGVGGGTFKIRLEMDGDNYVVKINGTPVMSGSYAFHRGPGWVGLGAYRSIYANALLNWEAEVSSIETGVGLSGGGAVAVQGNFEGAGAVSISGGGEVNATGAALGGVYIHALVRGGGTPLATGTKKALGAVFLRGGGRLTAYNKRGWPYIDLATPENLDAIASLVILKLDYCSRTFGVDPCFATGTECYNTWKSCKYISAYLALIQDHRFCSAEFPQVFPDARPYVSRVRLLPTEIKTNFTVSGRVIVDMIDELDSDVGMDPYYSSRAPAPALASFWKRFFARNVNYKGRIMEVYEGIPGAPESTYVLRWRGKLDNVKFKGSKVSVESVDLLKDLVKIEVPPKVSAKLATDSPAGESVSMSLESTDDLADSGYLLIDEEIVQYTSKDDVTRQIFGLVRGALGTVAADHFVGDKVSPVRYFAPQSGFDILLEMMIVDGGINEFEDVVPTTIVKSSDPSTGYIDVSDIGNVPLWGSRGFIRVVDGGVTEFLHYGSTAILFESAGGYWYRRLYIDRRSLWGSDPIGVMSPASPVALLDGVQINLSSFDRYKDFPEPDIPFGAILTTPEKLSDLYFEVADLLDCKSWVAEDLKITIRRNVQNEPGRTYHELSDDDDLEFASGAVDLNEKSRLTRVVIYWERNVLGKKDDPTEYRRVDVSIDPDAELNYDGPVEKKIFCRWISTLFGEETSIQDYVKNVGFRRVVRQRDAQNIVSFSLANKGAGVRTGDFLRLSTDEVLDEYGNPITKRIFQVVKRDKTETGHDLDVIQVAKSRICIISPSGFPDYPSATDAQREYGFISDSDGKMSDGTDGYFIW